jgi:hypothetical protein
MGIRGARQFKEYSRWLRKKQRQIYIRTKLSHHLAILLAIMVVARETPELMVKFGWEPPALNIGWPWLWPWLWLGVVLVVTAATIFAAVSESVGKNMKISHQELLFLYGMGTLLEQLQKLMCTKGDTRRPDIRLREFSKVAMNVVSEVFSVPGDSEAGLMVKLSNERAIRLTEFSREAKYREKLTVPLPPDSGDIEDPGSTGPAGIAFSRLRTVSVPEKGESVWSFKRERAANEDWYEAFAPDTCWVDAGEAFENFKSVLSVPIAALRVGDSAQKFGVLNISTTAKDPFVDRDFMMAECFAGVLAAAFVWTKNTAKKK